MNNGIDLINKQKQEQILKLVTHSFYKELMNYGVDSSDIVTVSVNLLDHITNSQNYTSGAIDYYNTMLKVEDIKDFWKERKELSYDGVTIKPVQEEHIPKLGEWVQTPEIQNTFIGLFPKNTNLLSQYLLAKEDRFYFVIIFDNKHLIGAIGAENIDPNFRKLEMKKFIGDQNFRGKGIGKMATFLFLYYAFDILNFNKVYIYSMDTNIKNINLNSKFGFGLEGILYDEVRLNGKFMDVLRMGLLKETWEEIFVR